MTFDIAYYDYARGSGDDAERAVIQGLGYNPIQMQAPELTGGADVVLFDAEQGSADAALGQILSDMSLLTVAGKTLIVNDETGSILTPDTTAPAAGQVNFVDDAGPLAMGPGGTLTDASLDGQGVSSYGYIDVDINVREDLELACLATREDPTHAVVLLQSRGEGYEVTSGVAAPTGLEAGDPAMTTFVANEVAYGAALFGLEETVLTGAGDHLSKVQAPSDIFALAGDDNVAGGRFADLIHAGDGDDKVSAGSGDDIVWGDNGRDKLVGKAGADQLWGGAGIDHLTGSGGDDFLEGGSSGDRLKGSGGDDSLIGGSGNDSLIGGAGDDIVVGGSGDDTLTGGAGSDRFIFGAGDNSGAFSAAERISDFVVGQDKIDLTEFGHAFTFSASFTHTAFEIVLGDNLGETEVSIDLNGDGTADQSFVAATADASMLTSADFVF